MRARATSSLARLALTGVIVFGLGGHALAATVMVMNNITVSETWTADNEYILTQPIYVTNGATLTIEPGTVIRGEGESSSGANDPGTLIIARGSKIQALGTKLDPIVMTDLLDDNIGDDSGSAPYNNKVSALSITSRWGGLVVLGRTYVSNNTLAGPNAVREVQIEGLTDPNGFGLYGACAASPIFPDCDDDDSGRISYMNIRYGGFNIAPDNEINGLTLGGVGRGTQIDHVEVFNNKDDGVECFGGTVNLKHIAVVNSGDDSLDYDEGWRGKVQFMYVQHGTPGTDRSDKGGEHDGGNSPDGSQPFAIPTIYNATFIGLGEAKQYSGNDGNTGLLIRDNAGTRYYNSFWGDFGGASYIIEGASLGGSETGPNTSGERAITPYSVDAFQIGPDSEFQLELQDNEFWCIDAHEEQLANQGVVTVVDGDDLNGDTVADAVEFGGSSSKEHYDNGGFTDAALDNNYRACAEALPIRQLTRGFNPLPTIADPVDVIDPRPAAGSVLLTTDRMPPDDGFFEAAAYKGAFGDENWADGWTTASRLDYFPTKGTVNVSADITVSETWTKDNEYVLTEPIYVTNGATLTIEPGTVIRGEGESAPNANDPGTLIIARGSKIDAVGTPDHPIVFTDLNDDNIGANPGTSPYDTQVSSLGITSRWGGLIVLGRTYVSNGTLAGPDASREVQIEGLNSAGALGFYGNCAASPVFPNCDDDDSGEISYISIRYGGFNIAPDNEINGLTLGGVGRGTQIDHVEVFNNKDDGVECFGGTVNLKNIAVVNSGDDSLDYDEGWRGKVQFFYVQHGTPGTDRSDKGGEHDGGNSPDGSQPFAIPTIYNATFIGLGEDKSYFGNDANSALLFRDNAGGRYYNSFFGDFGGASYIIEGQSVGGTGTGPDTSGERSITAYSNDAFQIGPESEFQLELQDNEFWCIDAHEEQLVNQGVVTVVDGGDLNGDTVPDAVEFGGSSSKEHYDNGGFTNASLDNNYRACADPLPIRALTRGFNPLPTIADPIDKIDPRPAAGSVLLATDRMPPNDGFFTQAAHKGAFRGENWAQGWTVTSRLGYFDGCAGTSGVGPAPDEVFPIDAFQSFDDEIRWEEPELQGLVGVQLYDTLRSDDASDFASATCLESEDSDAQAADASVPAAGDVFFYLVRAVNPCGDGTLGYASDGTERSGAACP